MPIVRLSTESISDWESFHQTCRKVFGFPGFYGMNMNAWIDCLSYLDEDSGMTTINLTPGEMLNVEVSATESFRQRVPEIFDALIECSSFVNQRYVEAGKSPVLSLVFL